jgi:hypothetical protein
MAERGVVLLESSFRKLRDEFRQIEADYQNLRRLLEHIGMRRHQGDGGDSAPIKWRNTHSSSCPPYGIIRVTGYLAASRTIEGSQPNATLQRIYLVNGPSPVAYQGYGRASWLLSPQQAEAWRTVAYDVADGTPALGEEWGPTPGQWTARKNRPGVLVLGAESSEQTLTGVQSVVDSLLGKTDASHAKGASGTVSIWMGAAGSEADTTINVTAYNRFAAVASDKWVHLTSTNGQWYLDAAEC